MEEKKEEGRKEQRRKEKEEVCKSNEGRNEGDKERMWLSVGREALVFRFAFNRFSVMRQPLMEMSGKARVAVGVRCSL